MWLIMLIVVMPNLMEMVALIIMKETQLDPSDTNGM